jgi:hypothetical protein
MVIVSIIEDTSDLNVSAGPDITIDYGTTDTLKAVVSGGTPPYLYEWTPATGLNDPAVLNPVASPSDTTEYTLKVTDVNGFFRTDRVTVNVVEYVSDLTVNAGSDVTINTEHPLL